MPDVLCVTESWTHPLISDSLLVIDQYDLYRQDRTNKCGGGCLLYIKASFKHFPLDLDVTSFSGNNCFGSIILSPWQKAILGAFLNLVTSLRNEQKSVVVIYFDLSKAFDKVSHRRLLVKLEALGMQSPLLDCFGSFLSNRSQKVLVALPTLDYLDTVFRFCNPDGGPQVQLMIKAGSDGFASLIGGLCSRQGRISMMI
ncbi:unnamed protein product [Schistocephalus solidus]|uniref:Reverse transcriptase domain-containing protein n=1 Tax=Schistocephalus solidus TaxID=70667 RepID=A0A183T1C8_SCHSO|nr:unnamed protein product [Schistocephalus solidus]